MRLPVFGLTPQSQQIKPQSKIKFGVIPDEVKDILEVTKTSPDAADNHLVETISKGLKYYVKLTQALSKSYTETMQDIVLDRVNKLTTQIGQIKTVEGLEKVIQLFDDNKEFEEAESPVSYQDIMSALVQKASELHHPDYLRKL